MRNRIAVRSIVHVVVPASTPLDWARHERCAVMRATSYKSLATPPATCPPGAARDREDMTTSNADRLNLRRAGSVMKLFF